MGALDSTCSANEYSSAADTFKIDHGKWARTGFDRRSHPFGLLLVLDLTNKKPVEVPKD